MARLYELDCVVAIRYSCPHVLLGLLTDGESGIIVNQPPQALQYPQEDTFHLRTHLLCDERIVHLALRTLFSGQDDLPPEEADTSVIE